MRQEFRLLQGAVVALCLVTIGVVLSCGGSTVAIAVQPPGIPTAYGDGSAGALNLTANGGITDGNTQFTSISITGAGTIVTVPSGTVIHCTGSFTIGAGATLTVSESVSAGFMQVASAGTISPQMRPAAQGRSSRPAGFPEVGGTGEYVNGASAGAGLGTVVARLLRLPGHSAGGGGGGGCGSQGGNGGGGLTILAFGAIQIDGTLLADGVDAFAGGGGGAGGIVVLASATSIATTGTVTAVGGTGGPSTLQSGAGGGGGGGVINLLAPAISGVDGVDYVVDEGAAGSDAVNATAVFRSGGGAGGGCGGSGGVGGDVDAADNALAPGNSSIGMVNRIVTADPVGLFL